MRQSAAEMLFAPLALVQIVGLTVAGLVLGLAGIGLDLEGGAATVAYAALMATGIADPIVGRYLLLPKASRAGASRAQLTVHGYSFAVAPALCAPVGAVITGSGWLALPLGGIAVYAWFAVWTYLQELPEVSEPR